MQTLFQILHLPFFKKTITALIVYNTIMLMGVYIKVEFSLSQREFKNKPLPEFSLRTARGETVTHKSFNDQNIILMYWTTWCGACKPDLAALDGLKLPKGWAMQLVNDHESSTKALEFLDKHYPKMDSIIDSQKTFRLPHQWPDYYLVKNAALYGPLKSRPSEPSFLANTQAIIAGETPESQELSILEITAYTLGVYVYSVPFTSLLIVCFFIVGSLGPINGLGLARRLLKFLIALSVLYQVAAMILFLKIEWVNVLYDALLHLNNPLVLAGWLLLLASYLIHQNQPPTSRNIN